MKFFVKHLKVNRDGVLVMLLFQAGLFLMGVLMVLAINAFINDPAARGADKAHRTPCGAAKEDDQDHARSLPFDPADWSGAAAG